jgi:hypothetical protein
MALSDIVTISISTASAKVTQAGFGVPLILAADAPSGFIERVRFYSDLAEVATDFASGTATHDMAAALFAQEPGVVEVAVGRLALKPTQRWALTPTAANSTKYEMEVNGHLISYTSDGSATVTEIIAGLKTAIDLLSLGITVSDQTTYMRIVANTAGAYFSVKVLNSTLANLKIAQDHADPGAATDLDAILVEDSSWYCILNPFNSKAMALAIAAWAESNKKLFVAATQDSDVVNLALGSDTGGSETVAGAAKTAAYFRTALMYHPENGEFADAAWVGKVLPSDPGSETWAFHTLAGVDVTTLTSTQHTNATNKLVSTYQTYAGLSLTGVGNQTSGGMGRVSGNEFIDVIRLRDWTEARMSEAVIAAKAQAAALGRKIPFTDNGIAVIQGKLEAILAAGVKVGGFAADPAPVVTVPKASEVSDADKALRKLTGIKFDATLAGAIQVTSVTGAIAL